MLLFDLSPDLFFWSKEKSQFRFFQFDVRIKWCGKIENQQLLTFTWPIWIEQVIKMQFNFLYCNCNKNVGRKVIFRFSWAIFGSERKYSGANGKIILSISLISLFLHLIACYFSFSSNCIWINMVNAMLYMIMDDIFVYLVTWL